MLTERFKEWATYWYFRFPKWVWMFVLFVVFALLNAALAWVFPVWFSDWQREEKTGWVYRLICFYITAALISSVSVLAWLTVVPFTRWLYNALPDDPRKAKEQEGE